MHISKRAFAKVLAFGSCLPSMKQSVLSASAYICPFIPQSMLCMAEEIMCLITILLGLESFVFRKELERWWVFVVFCLKKDNEILFLNQLQLCFILLSHREHTFRIYCNVEASIRMGT